MTENATIGDDPEESADNTEAAEATSATPLGAARRHCLWCCNSSANEVRLCPAKACPLWAFRFGHRPTAQDKAAVANVELYPLEQVPGRPIIGGEFHAEGG